MLRLVFPNQTHKAAHQEMIDEWSNFEKTPASPGALFFGDSYEEFLEKIQMDPVTEDPDRVPSTLLFLMEDDHIHGAIQIRHHIDHPILSKHGGHIGYGIRPSSRQKGYGTRMLELALPECKKLGLEKIMLTCDPENIGSNKIILSNGGTLTDTNEYEGRMQNVYWINV